MHHHYHTTESNLNRYLPSPMSFTLLFCFYVFIYSFLPSFIFFFQARLYWGHYCSRGEWEQTTGSLVYLLPDVGLACSLYGVRVEVYSEVKPEASPLRWCSVQRACAVPCFFSRLFRSGSRHFWSLCIFCPALAPTVHSHSYFQSHIVSLYFVVRGKVSPGASFAALQQGSQIPASLIPTRDSTSLFLRSKGLKVSFSETSSCWTGATDPSLYWR